MFEVNQVFNLTLPMYAKFFAFPYFIKQYEIYCPHPFKDFNLSPISDGCSQVDYFLLGMCTLFPPVPVYYGIENNGIILLLAISLNIYKAKCYLFLPTAIP
jgi:hypothetical protein